MTTPLVITNDTASIATDVADNAIRVLKATAVNNVGTVLAEALPGFDDPSSNITGVEKLVKAIAIGVAKSDSESSDNPWISPTLVNGWTHYDGPYGPVQHKIDETNTVFIRGVVTGGTLTSVGDASGVIFTLPDELRSTTELIFSTPCLATETFGYCAQIRVKTNGDVQLYSAFNVDGMFGFNSLEWVSLTLSFKADQ